MPRTAADILAGSGQPHRSAPVTVDKWLTASVIDDAATVISAVFDEADRRDPNHQITRIALVDGNNRQINRIHTEAAARGIDITIIVDFIHVLQYLWKAAWCFHDEADPAAETWVRDKATAILGGHARAVAAGIRRRATRHRLAKPQRAAADACADYLTAKAPYLDYPQALQSGWPIATGVIEGACRHLVKDRLDMTGTRWGLTSTKKPSSSSAPCTATTTSTPTGDTTSTANPTESTELATSTAKSQGPHDLTSEEPHPNRFVLFQTLAPVTSVGACERISAISRTGSSSSSR